MSYYIQDVHGAYVEISAPVYGAQLYVQDSGGAYVPVIYPSSPPPTNPSPGYAPSMSGGNPYPATHSYGFGIPAGASYGFFNIATNRWLGSDFIGLPQV